jgi:predicted dehydrogenase
MLPDVDAVTIAVPNHLHTSLCVEALAAATPVLVEKPACITFAELRLLEEAFHASRVPVMVGYRLRWNPALLALRTGLAGVRAVRCTYRLGIDRLAHGKPWTTDPLASGGPFMTLGVHALDLARWLARADGAALGDLQARALEPDASGVPLVVSVSGRLPGGVLVEAGADLRGDAEFRLSIETDADAGTYADGSLPGPWPEDPEASAVEYGAMCAAFVRAAISPGTWNDDRTEILQCHRELLAARAMAQPDQPASEEP